MTSVVEAVRFVGPVSRINIHAEQVQFSQIWEYFLSNLCVGMCSIEPTTGTLSCSVILGPRTLQLVDIYHVFNC
jgi:hypothetical protein